VLNKCLKAAWAGLPIAALTLSPGVAFAAQAQKLDGGNTAWILTSTALVLFMTIPGLALFYGGLVRTKNVLSVLMQCFSITCLMSILWLAYAYSLAFNGGGAFIGNLDKMFLKGVSVTSLTGNIPETVFVMFQLTFAIITPALIVGAYAERMKFSAMFLFSGIWLTIVYAPVAHWVWGGGWLGGMGALDFAGGTVVHINSGVSALVAAILLGKRHGFPDQPPSPHNLTMTVTGASMLWVGWFGFNAGSALAADGSAGMAMLVTHMSSAAAALTWMFIEWSKFGKPSALGIATGAVAGLVGITPASGYVGPIGALVIGVSVGVICFNAIAIVKQRFKIDDSLDVFPVHGIGGIVGALLTGVFVHSGLGGVGLAEGMSMGSQVWVQLVSVTATAVYAGGLTFIILKVVDALVGLRVSADDEQVGLDPSQHNETGYEI
jgi:Amt family ammonium transporter